MSVSNRFLRHLCVIIIIIIIIIYYEIVLDVQKT